MYNARLTWWILCLLLCTASPGFCLEIRLHDRALVESSTVRLGDIASITPEGPEAQQWAQQQVCQAPLPGESRVVQARSLIGSLHGVPGARKISWRGAENITVQRQGVELGSEALKTIVADFLQQNIGNLPDVEFRFTSVRAPEKIVLPTGDVQYTVTPSKPGILGSSSFSILFQVNGKTVKNCTVRGKLEAIAEVVTARVNMRKGSIITADQLTMARKDISRSDKPYPGVDLVTGMQAKRTIRAGAILDSHNVTPPPLVRKGEPVKIIASKGQLQISTTGIAIMDGRQGDFIRVKNVTSSKLIYCRVDSPGIVSVEF